MRKSRKDQFDPLLKMYNREDFTSKINLPPTSTVAEKIAVVAAMFGVFVFGLFVLTVSFAMISSHSTFAVIFGNLLLLGGIGGLSVIEYYLFKRLIRKEKNEDSNH